MQTEGVVLNLMIELSNAHLRVKVDACGHGGHSDG